MQFLTFALLYILIHADFVEHFCCCSHIHVMQFAKNKTNQLFCDVNAIELETRTDMRSFMYHGNSLAHFIHRYLKVRVDFSGIACQICTYTIETKDQGYFRFLWHFMQRAVLLSAFRPGDFHFVKRRLSCVKIPEEILSHDFETFRFWPQKSYTHWSVLPPSISWTLYEITICRWNCRFERILTINISMEIFNIPYMISHTQLPIIPIKLLFIKWTFNISLNLSAWVFACIDHHKVIAFQNVERVDWNCTRDFSYENTMCARADLHL